MSEKYLNKTGLAYLLSKIKAITELSDSFVFDSNNSLIEINMNSSENKQITIGDLSVESNSSGETITFGGLTITGDSQSITIS